MFVDTTKGKTYKRCSNCRLSDLPQRNPIVPQQVINESILCPDVIDSNIDPMLLDTVNINAQPIEPTTTTNLETATIELDPVMGM